MPNPLPTELRGYFDRDGLMLLWPARGKAEKRMIALEWMAGHFESDRTYSEKEVNAILKSLHGFNDHAFLRRELVDRGYLSRKQDGTEYRRLGVRGWGRLTASTLAPRDLYP